MALIFFLSHQPDLSSGLGVWDTIGRKFVHMAEYALLCALLWRALARRLTRARAVVLAAAISVAYAASDEIHQSFVEGRHGTPVDVAIDSVGIAAAGTLLLRRRPA
jgi:VanZ family protein